MDYIKELLKKSNGREKFKKICSINHGSKFSNKYATEYYELYDKSLEYLKYLDNHFKKGKKYEEIKKNLKKIPMLTTEETSRYSNQSES